MAITDTCPRCGQSVITLEGKCQFCGIQVAKTNLGRTDAEYVKANKAYSLASNIFLVVGVLYLAFAIGGTMTLHEPMIGLFLAAGVTLAHAIMLIYKNDWVQSVTKNVCYVRLGLFIFVLALILPYLLNTSIVGIGFLILFVVDICALILMIKNIDEVYFA